MIFVLVGCGLIIPACIYAWISGGCSIVGFAWEWDAESSAALRTLAFLPPLRHFRVWLYSYIRCMKDGLYIMDEEISSIFMDLGSEGVDSENQWTRRLIVYRAFQMRVYLSLLFTNYPSICSYLGEVYVEISPRQSIRRRQTLSRSFI